MGIICTPKLMTIYKTPDIMRLRLLFILLAAATITIAGCDKSASTPVNSQQSADIAGISVESRVLETVPKASLASMIETSMQSDMQETIVFSKSGHGLAYIEPYDGKYRVVHNRQPGRSYATISNLSISRDGKRVAYVAHVDEKFRKIVVDNWEGPLFDDIGMPEFSPDGRDLLYSVFKGRVAHIVINNKVIYEYQLEQGPVFSSDPRLIAFSVKNADNKKNQLIICDLLLKNRTVIDSCGPFFAKSDDSTKLAAVCSENDKSMIKVIDFVGRKIISTSQSHGRVAQLKFSANNNSLINTVVEKGGERYIVFKGREEEIPTGDEFFSDPLLFADSGEVGVIIGTVYKARLYKAFNEGKQDEREYGYISDFVASMDGRHHAYMAVNVNDVQQHIVVDGNEGPKFDRIVSPVFSPDNRFLVYRARQSGKRFLVVSDLKGNILRLHKPYEMVFQPVFAEEGRSVAYGVLDGNEFWWKVEKL